MKLAGLFLLILPFVLKAQEKPKDGKVQYASSYEWGLLAGKYQTPFTARIIQGARYNNYEAGVGIALDSYGFRTLPVFFHAAYNFFAHRSTPYVYIDVGSSLPWNDGTLPPKYLNPGTGEPGDDDWHKLHAGLYGEAGVGYKIMLNKRNMFLINAGYTYKKFSYDQYSYVWNGGLDATNSFSFDYNRLVFRLGFTL